MSNNRNNNSNSTLAMAALAGGALFAIGSFLYNKLSSREQPQQHRSRPQRQSSRTNSVPEPDNVCCICLEELSPPMEQLPCLHLFHAVCIKEALNENTRCPICSRPLTESEKKKYTTRLKEILSENKKPMQN